MNFDGEAKDFLRRIRRTIRAVEGLDLFYAPRIRHQSIQLAMAMRTLN